MTCPQPNGCYAVSDVKGFIAFGGKTGVRGRVVSREGSLIGQAFLAGLAGGFGRGLSANTNTTLTGTNVNVNGQRQKLGTGNILEGGLGEGIATSGDMVSKHLIERAEQYQPVIEMPTGIDVEIVFSKACSSTDEEGAMKLKPLNLGKPRLKQVLMPLVAIALGSGGSLVWANANAAGAESAAPNAVHGHSPSEADQAVTALLKQRLPRTQVSRVNCQVVDGVCEVTAGSQLFYVDRTARYLLIGRDYDMQRHAVCSDRALRWIVKHSIVALLSSS